MTPVTDRSFGLLIAYLLPGFSAVALWGPLVPGLPAMVYGDAAGGPTVGGFLYGTLAATGVGLLLSTVRWAVLDAVHHATGVRPPVWNYAGSSSAVDAYRVAVELHYRYYQFYGSTLLILLLMLALPPSGFAGRVLADAWAKPGLLLMATLVFVASRDALSKYYARSQGTTTPASPRPQTGIPDMTNGGDHSHHSDSNDQTAPRSDRRATDHAAAEAAPQAEPKSSAATSPSTQKSER